MYHNLPETNKAIDMVLDLAKKIAADPVAKCELRHCPLYKGDCLDAGKCLAKERNLIGTGWDFSGKEL